MPDVPTIVVTTTLPEPAMELLRELGEVVVLGEGSTMSQARLHESAAGASAVVCTVSDTVDAALAETAGPGLRVVSTVAVGYDNVDVAALDARGVVVTNTPGVLTDATADLTMGLLLAITRRLGEGERLLRAGRPWSFHLGFMLGTGLRGARLGIVGLGQIGTAVARRARAFGMEIAYTGRRRADAALETELAAEYLSLDTLLATCDVVSLHCPLTPRTRHLIDADALSAMKPDAYLINTTRGEVVHEAALADALRRGLIAGAALDVFEHEPQVEPALLDLDSVVLTPHLGSATVQTRTAMAVLAARNVAAVLGGEPALTPVAP